MKISELLKKLNLPSKAIMSDISQQDVLKMSDKEIMDTANKEKAKVMLVKDKLRSIRGDLKKKMDNIMEQKEKLEREIMQVRYSPETPANRKKYRELNQRAKSLADRSFHVKNQANQMNQELSAKLAQIEKTVTMLYEELSARVQRRKKEHLAGGESSGMSDKAFNKKELQKGTKVESEHTPNPSIAKEIAKDHLAETSNYYKELPKIEEAAKK